MLVPKKFAITNSLIKPKILDKKVSEATIRPDLKSDNFNTDFFYLARQVIKIIYFNQGII